MTPLNYKKLQTLDGKAAVFVRGFIDHLVDHELTKQDDGLTMRPAQEAGKAAVESLGEEISIAYVSKLTVLLQECKVVYKERRGKKFVLFPGVEYDPFCDFVEDKGFGLSMTKELPDDQVQARSEFLDHMKEHGAVRIRAVEPLEKAAYMLAIDKFKSGEYDMVFVDRNNDLDVLDYGPDFDWTSDLFIERPTASVANR